MKTKINEITINKPTKTRTLVGPGIETTNVEKFIDHMINKGYGLDRVYKADDPEVQSSNPIYDFSWKIGLPKFRGLMGPMGDPTTKDKIYYQTWEQNGSMWESKNINKNNMKTEFKRMQKLAGLITENTQPDDTWKSAPPAIKIKLLKRLGVDDESIAKKYAEAYKDKSWVEVKKIVSDLTINENAKQNKMKKSELKAKIKEMIMAETNIDEAKKKKDEDTDEIEMEDDNSTPEQTPSFTPNETPNTTPETNDIPAEVKSVQDALNKAQVEAEKLGDKKLLAQIGNTITFFTRAHISEPGKEQPKI